MARLFHGGGIATTTLRRIAGIRARRPSWFAACIGGQLRKTTYAKPPAGMGGRRNVAVHEAFKRAVASCKGARGRA